MVANVGLKMQPMLTSADVNVLIQFEYAGFHGCGGSMSAITP